jgi:hypothetical protein
MPKSDGPIYGRVPFTCSAGAPFKPSNIIAWFSCQILNLMSNPVNGTTYTNVQINDTCMYISLQIMVFQLNQHNFHKTCMAEWWTGGTPYACQWGPEPSDFTWLNGSVRFSIHLDAD